jgi:hypothetical protein
MPAFIRREQLEEVLLQELQAARRRYDAGECTRDEYQQHLERFNALILHGEIPDDYKANGKSA